MTEDPIVAEIRQARHAHAAQFNNDIAAICADYRRLEKESGREYVNYPLRLTEPPDDVSAPTCKPIGNALNRPG